MSKRILMGFIGTVAFALTLGLASVSQAGPITVCGDGLIEGGETCDDSNTVTGDGCDADCHTELCGDGIVTLDEECDDGNTVAADGCENDCTETPAVCGDGLVHSTDEECDDGNTIDGDGCSSTCMFEQECGNGVLEAPEECDDGNTISGDGCDAVCVIEVEEPYVATKDDQKCVNGINKSWGGVIKAGNKATGKCIKDISKGKVTGTFFDCSNAANLGKAFDKTTKSDAKSCPPAAGMFAYIGDSQAVNAAGAGGSLEANVALLGNPANIILKADKDNSKCQQEVQKGLTKYLDGLHTDGNKAKKDCLKGKKVPQCTLSTELATAMTTDGKKSTKALSSWETKTGKKCSDTSTIATNFPGACASSATFTDLVSCSAVKARCAYCASLNTTDGLAVDCDEYAAAGVAGSCDPFVPTTTTVTATTTTGSSSTTTVVAAVCGDGVTEGTEECDDGNTVDGDLCNNSCEGLALCGDGIVWGGGAITPAEECDDGNTVAGDGCENDCTVTP